MNPSADRLTRRQLRRDRFMAIRAQMDMPEPTPLDEAPPPNSDPILELRDLLESVASLVHAHRTTISGGWVCDFPEYYQVVADNCSVMIETAQDRVLQLRSDKRFVAGVLGNLDPDTSLLLTRAYNGLDSIANNFQGDLARLAVAKGAQYPLSDEFWTAQFAVLDDQIGKELQALVEKLTTAATWAAEVADGEDAKLNSREFAAIAGLTASSVSEMVARDGEGVLLLSVARAKWRERDGRRRPKDGAGLVDGFDCNLCGTFHRGAVKPKECGGRQDDGRPCRCREFTAAKGPSSE